jgi:hypothetical protein
MQKEEFKFSYSDICSCGIMLKPLIAEYGMLGIFKKNSLFFADCILLAQNIFMQNPSCQHCQSVFMDQRSEDILPNLFDTYF